MKNAALVAIGLLLADTAHAQTSGQLWAGLSLAWPKTARLSYQVEIEPEALVIAAEGEPDWVSLEVTPSVEYAAKKWLDFVGEVLVASTKQTNDLNSREVTERAGVRFHLLSRTVPTLAGIHTLRELPPRRRLVLRDLVRLEQRNIFYSDGAAPSSSWRLRNRLEFQLPLNHTNMTLDKTRYMLADWEWFATLDDEPKERFASKQRIRVGLGYRQSVKWRYEVLYIWGRSLDTTSDSFTTSDNILDLKLKLTF